MYITSVWDAYARRSTVQPLPNTMPCTHRESCGVCTTTARCTAEAPPPTLPDRLLPSTPPAGGAVGACVFVKPQHLSRVTFRVPCSPSTHASTSQIHMPTQAESLRGRTHLHPL